MCIDHAFMTTLGSRDVRAEGERKEGKAPVMLVAADTKHESLCTVPVPAKGTRIPGSRRHLLAGWTS